MQAESDFLKMFGGRIRVARERLRLTQEELAARVGKAQNIVSRYENGVQALRITEIPVFAKALEVEPGYFFEGDHAQEQPNSEKAKLLAELGQRLKQARDQVAIESEDFAEILGISEQQLLKYEAGNQEMRITELIECAQILRIPLSFLLGESPILDSMNQTNQVLAPSLRLAANMTFYRLLQVQLLLAKNLYIEGSEYDVRMTISDMNAKLAEVRNELLRGIEQYFEIILEIYKSYSMKRPGRDPMELKIYLPSILAPDLRDFWIKHRSPD